jgi:hypothetical protein
MAFGRNGWADTDFPQELVGRPHSTSEKIEKKIHKKIHKKSDEQSS